MTRTLAEMMGEVRTQVPAVSPKDAAAELASGAAVFLDVREPVEWEQHIPGSTQIPRGLLEFAADPASPRHNDALAQTRRVVVYCRSGARAGLAALTLKEMGYEDVANLTGGIVAWQEAGLPLTDHHSDI